MKTIITSQNNFFHVKIKELWDFRQLIWSLAWRDIKVRYVQSYLGFLWLIINPLMNIIILSFVFGYVVNADTENVSPILFAGSGLAAWSYFASLASGASEVILNSQEMVKKVYFPRLVLPLSKAISGLFDFGGTLIVLVVLIFIYQGNLSVDIGWLFFFLLVSIICGLTVGIWASALTIRYRDLRFVIPYFIRLGMFITPVAYSSSMVPQNYKFVYYLNPMAGVVEGFRWSLIGVEPMDTYVFYSIGIVLILFILGVAYFSLIDRYIADWI